MSDEGEDQLPSTPEGNSVADTTSYKVSIRGGDFGGANLGVVHNYVKNDKDGGVDLRVVNYGTVVHHHHHHHHYAPPVQEAPNSQNDDIADPASDLNQSGQGSSSSEEFTFPNPIKVFKKKPLHSKKEIYEGEMKTAIGQIPVAVKLVKHSNKAMEEAKSLYAMDSHPNVVRIIGSGILVQSLHDDILLAMELCSKETLYNYIVNRKEQDFDLNLSIQHAVQLIKGLKHIHSKKVIHQDLKPHNILFSRDEEHPYEQVKITDFGISKQTDNKETSQIDPGTGTVGYKAPEVIKKKKISLKSDIFSLGVLLYFSLSNGKHPYGQNYLDWDSNISKNVEPSLDGLLIEDETIRKRVENILRRMLQHDKEQRPTASEILVEWNQINSEVSSPESVQAPTSTSHLQNENNVQATTSNDMQPGTSGRPSSSVIPPTPSLQSDMACALPVPGVELPQQPLVQKSKDEWEVSVEDIKWGKEIGSGAYGTVYQCRCKGHGVVAVKKLHIANPTQSQIKDFKNEVAMLKKTRHDNILLFMGYTIKEQLCIITQWCEGSSLYHHLHESETKFSMIQLVDFAGQIAQGMEYLHWKNIIHRDIKSKNIFLKDLTTVKIGDFGLAILVSGLSLSEQIKEQRGTTRWMAPEILRMDKDPYTFKSDVYAFGIVLYELSSGKLPYHGMEDPTITYQVGHGILSLNLSFLRNDTPKEFKHLMCSCYEKEKENRPPFEKIVISLKAIYDAVPKVNCSQSV